MLCIADLEKLQKMLFRVSALVDLMERGEGRFVSEVKSWCSDLEKLLTLNWMSEAGTIAGLRGLLVSVERGALPQEIRLMGKVTRKKVREVTAIEVIRLVVHVLSEALRKDQARIAEAERIVTQLVSAAKAKGIVDNLNLERDRAMLTADIWHKMSGNPEISAGTVNVEGLVGPSDALVLLDRVIAKLFAAPG
jgi:hypothetical protein